MKNSGRIVYRALMAGLVLLACGVAPSSSANADEGPRVSSRAIVIASGPPHRLVEASGVRTRRGCAFPRLRLKLAPGDFAVRAKVVRVDATRCRETVEARSDRRQRQSDLNRTALTR